MEINIGFKFSKRHELFGKTYWRTYEIIGFKYGRDEGYSDPNWKTKDDILSSLNKYVQIITLPYPNYNALPGLYDNMENSQLSMTWESLKKLQISIENDMKLLPQFRQYKF